MIKTTLMIPVYNEIRFIERTLQSVIGQADQIIISDNASNDGTSEICQEFAQKHPEVEYKRHEKNIGAAKNCDYCLNQAKGEYIMFVGGHDMISQNYVRNMSILLDENPDAVLAFPKKTVFLDELYSFDKLYLAEVFGDDLISDSPYHRVNSIVNKISYCVMWNGLHRSHTFKNILNEYLVFKDLFHDVVCLTNLARKGKFIMENDSTFFRINNRKLQKPKERFIRVIQMIRALETDENINPSEWLLTHICGTYKLAKEMQKLSDTPTDFDKKILKDLFKRNKYIFGDEANFENISVIPGEETLVEEVKNEIIKEKNLQKKNLQKKIDKLAEKYNNKKIVLYGAGAFFDDIKKNHDISKLNIVAVSDIKFTEESEYKGFKAIPPQKISEQKPDVILLTVLNKATAFPYIEKLVKENNLDCKIILI